MSITPLSLSADAHTAVPGHKAVFAQVPDLLRQAQVPGLTMAVLTNGNEIQTAHFGLADQKTAQAITDDTLFEAASLSKPILAAITLRLAERGEFSLNQPLHQILPNPRIKNQAWAEKLTARLVLSHQTGLPNWSNGDIEFLAEPETGFFYSGQGYVYLQQVLEKVTGLTYQQLAMREIFQPLQMQHAYFTWSADEPVILAKGHDRIGHSSDTPIPEANAAASLHTTAHDYARFVQAWMNGELWQNNKHHRDPLGIVKLKGDEQGGSVPAAFNSEMFWGLGWGIQASASEDIVWHWGDNGDFRAFVAWNKRTGNAVVVFTNSENGLAICKALVEPVVGDMNASFSWLNYPQYDTPGWQEMQRGLIAQEAGDLALAQREYTQALALQKDHPRLARRIRWLDQLMQHQGSPADLTASQKNAIAGQYGPRNIVVDSGQLYYQRQGGNRFKMVYLDDSLFALENLFEFRIKIKRDEQGRPTALIGQYLNGYEDESLRDAP